MPLDPRLEWVGPIPDDPLERCLEYKLGFDDVEDLQAKNCLVTYDEKKKMTADDGKVLAAQMIEVGPCDIEYLFLGNNELGDEGVIAIAKAMEEGALPKLLTVERVVRVARTAAAEVERGLGVPSPRVAVCGLNPHAGEDGKLGREDDEVVRPAVARLVAAGIDASGPHPADTVFARALGGEFDLVVAQYHDQGLIPVKTVDFGRSVNITAGLSIVRTSVDHGTARDIAWTGRADAGPMEAAIRMAVRLAVARR